MGTLISENLNHAIQVLNIKKSTLAMTLGVSAASVSGWLNDKTPTIENLVNISKALNLSLDWLISGHGPMHLHGPFHLSALEDDILQELKILPNDAMPALITLLASLSHAGTAEDLKKWVHARNTLEATEMSMIIIDDKNIIVDINEPYLHIFNLTLEQKGQIIGTSFLDLVHPEKRVEVIMQFKNGQEKGKPISCAFDHLRFHSDIMAHTYINGIFRKLSDRGFYVLSAFYVEI